MHRLINYSLVLVLGILLFGGLANSAQAQSTTQPTFGVIAPCPDCSSPTTQPVPSQNQTQPTVVPTTNTVNPPPIADPCETQTALADHTLRMGSNIGVGTHWNPNGLIGQSITKFLNIFFEMINNIFSFFDLPFILPNLPTNPAPNPAPTSAPNPPGTNPVPDVPNPTTEPCPPAQPQPTTVATVPPPSVPTQQPTVPQPTTTQPAGLCGNKSTAPTGNAPGFSCTGNWGTTPMSDGYYVPTYFGCSKGYPKDPYDNCLPACGNIPECTKAGVSGRACEELLQWFAADAGRYGCNAKLKVTNPTTGKAVIVRAIDQGPACSVEKGRGKMDISQAAYVAIDAGNMVHVEKVPEATPLGPIPVCSATSPNQTPNQPIEQPSTPTQTTVTGPCGSVVEMGDKKIAPLLRQGGSGSYSVLPTNVSNCNYTAAPKLDTDSEGVTKYWCTFMVVDAYNLAGIKGLTRAHSFVVDMHAFMAQDSRYQFIDYRTDKKGALQKVKPGFNFYIETLFLDDGGSEHTGLVKSLTVDQNGNGSMVTIESNSGATTHTWPIDAWVIKNGSRPIVGFGGPRN